MSAVIAGCLYFLNDGTPTRVSSNQSTSSPTGPEEVPAGGSAPKGGEEVAKAAGSGISQPAWEKAADDVIGNIQSPTDHPAACREMIKLVKTSPAAAQGTLAKHIVNLADDGAYMEAFALMDDRTLSPKFHKTISAELLNRPDAIKLPGLLKIASSEWHPFREKALPILGTLTGEDAGEDWAKWAKIVQDKLNTQPATTAGSGVGSGSSN